MYQRFVIDGCCEEIQYLEVWQTFELPKPWASNPRETQRQMLQAAKSSQMDKTRVRDLVICQAKPGQMGELLQVFDAVVVEIRATDLQALQRIQSFEMDQSRPLNPGGTELDGHKTTEMAEIREPGISDLTLVVKKFEGFQ